MSVFGMYNISKPNRILQKIKFKLFVRRLVSLNLLTTNVPIIYDGNIGR